MKEIDWKAVPKAALVDTLRNCQQGPSNLSRQDKPDLVRIARAYLAAKPDYRDSFITKLQEEIQYRKGVK